MLHVDLHNILTEEDALQKISDIFNQVEQQKETFVVTKNGRPVFAIVDIETLEKAEATPIVETTPVVEAPVIPAVPQPEIEIQMPTIQPIPEMQPPAIEPVRLSFLEPISEPVVTPQVSPSFSPLPPLQGMPELPDMPEDPNNNSPLA